ncbi:MAG: LEPR-XLL domain-containing protein, partial [Planctomycetota bacterium]|nr:LEPR-XLL domain-containing protein [Planctomycetota bacterium]
MTHRHQPALVSQALGRAQKGRKASRKRAPRPRSLRVEQLESRVLLSANPPPVETYFLPFPAADVLTALKTIQPPPTPPATTVVPTSPVSTFVSIAIAADGARVYYDQWENGYVSNIVNPSPAEIYNSVTNPAGVQIWGDGDLSNGYPPSNPLSSPTSYPTDVLRAGNVIILQSDSIPIPRISSEIRFDGGDKLAASTSVSIGLTSCASSTVTMLTDALVVNDTSQWGSDYDVPIGTNTNLPWMGADPNDPSLFEPNFFDYTGLTIMAAKDGTTVKIDPNGDGVFEATVSLNQGQSYLVNNGVTVTNPDLSTSLVPLLQGARVVSVASGDPNTADPTKPIQVDLITGRIGGAFASRWVTLRPRSDLSSDYVSPVSTGFGRTDGINHPTAVYLYNPNPTAILVTYVSRDGSGLGPLTTAFITVPARSSAKQIVPVPLDPGEPLEPGFPEPLVPGFRQGSGTHFYTAGGEKFYATSITDVADDYLITIEGGQVVVKYSSQYDWGFVVRPVSTLTRQAQVGLGFGRDPTELVTRLNENGSPVWVTPVGNGETPVPVYVDYKGDNAGPYTDPNGFHYDREYDLRELQRQKVFDPSGNQSGMLLYTLSPDPQVRLAVAWGEDPKNASSNVPGVDAGTSVAPLQDFAAGKIGSLAVDANADGLVTPGDTLLYTINVNNGSRKELLDVKLVDYLPANSTYVAGSTEYTITLPGGTPSPVPPAVIPDGPPGSLFPLDGLGYTLSTLPALATWTVTFRAKVKDALTPGVCSVPVPGSNACVVNTGTVSVSSLLHTVPLFWETPVFQPYANLKITKDDGALTYVPGAITVYTIEVSNLGPDSVVAAPVKDLFPPTIISATWTASPSAGASVAASSGIGDINTTVNLTLGSTVTFTVTAQTDPAATGDLVNTATVEPPLGTIDPVLTNNTYTDTDRPTPQNNVGVTTVDIKGGSALTNTVGTEVPGTSFIYNLPVSNAGPSTATNVTVSDPIPAGLASFVWSGNGR